MKNILKQMSLILAIIFISGCTKETIDDSKINIVTSFYPMYIATINIADGIDNVEVRNMTASTTGCLHDYQITTSDMIKLSHADIFVINGDGMESFMEKAISTYPKLQIVNASEDIKENIGTHDFHEEEYHAEHDHEDNNHYWVSISLYIEQIKNIAEQLGEIDSKNKDKYVSNAEKYIEELTALRTKMHDELDDVPNKNIITFHEAFEFFADEFDLDVVAVIEREPGTYPSSREVANIIDIVKSKDVKAIFVEPQYSRSAADTIARETGVSVYTLDPVVTGEYEKDSYIQIMNENLSSLVKALKGSE